MDVRRVALLVARVGFTVAVLAAVAYATVRQWPAVRDTLAGLDAGVVAASSAMVLLGLGAQTMSFQAALRDLGHPVGVPAAGRVYLIGLLAKYLPGSVWTFVAQMELGRREAIPRSRALLAAVVCLGLSTAAALLLGVFGLPVLFEMSPVVTAVVLAAVPVALGAAHPRVLTWLVQRFLALVRRPPLDRPLTWTGVLTVLGWSTAAWFCFGVHLWLLAGAGTGLLRCTGAFALGLTAGTLAFLSPSGLGVREAVVAAALLPALSSGAALGVALASRMIFTVADVVAAGVAAAAGVVIARRAAARRTARSQT